VLTAGIAREYDRAYVAERPELFLLPIAASLATATLLYGSLRLFVLRGPRGQARGRFRAFLGLFWLTAPLAWIYAVPVERFLEPVPAALLNITFLAVVATWRVALISRVAAVLFGAPFARALGAILLPSSLLVLTLSFFTQISLVPLMGGISLAPETKVLLRAAGFAATGAVVLGLAALALLAASPNRSTTPVPPPSPAHFPTLPLAALLLLWTALAAYPQLEVRRNARVDALVAAERYREALDLLSSHTPRDFSPTRRIAPDPQRAGSRSGRHLPGIISAMDGRDASWVRALYLDYLAIQIGPEYHRPPLEALTSTAQSLARLPEGADFARVHRVDLERIAAAWLGDAVEGAEPSSELRTLLEAYQPLGIDPQRPEAAE
jgi:hypothetical protein